jgi:hypothetical protein
MAITWIDEAERSGIDPDQAKEIFAQMIKSTTAMVRDNILKENEIDVPADILEGEIVDDDDDNAIPEEFR